MFPILLQRIKKIYCNYEILQSQNLVLMQLIKQIFICKIFMSPPCQLYNPGFIHFNLHYIIICHGGGEGVKKWSNLRYLINERPQSKKNKEFCDKFPTDFKFEQTFLPASGWMTFKHKFTCTISNHKSLILGRRGLVGIFVC